MTRCKLRRQVLFSPGALVVSMLNSKPAQWGWKKRAGTYSYGQWGWHKRAGEGGGRSCGLMPCAARCIVSLQVLERQLVLMWRTAQLGR